MILFIDQSVFKMQVIYCFLPIASQKKQFSILFVRCFSCRKKCFHKITLYALGNCPPPLFTRRCKRITTIQANRYYVPWNIKKPLKYLWRSLNSNKIYITISFEKSFIAQQTQGSLINDIMMIILSGFPTRFIEKTFYADKLSSS